MNPLQSLFKPLLKKTWPLAALIALGSALAFAQGSSQQTAQDGSAAGAVRVSVLVTGEAGHPVAGLRGEDFQVSENGAPQTINYFSAEPLPVSYGLMVDNSGSLRSQINWLVATGKLIVSKSGPEDETLLVRFVGSDKIEKMTELTSNKAALEKALESMFVEGGQSAIVDAVYRTAKELTEGKRGADASRRRAIILLTDGDERNSYYKKEQLFNFLRTRDVQVFVIGFVKDVNPERDRLKSIEFLKRLAQETGGRAFFPDEPSELTGIADEVANDLRAQYVIGYNSGDATRGTYRTLRVTVRDASAGGKRTVYARSGYTSPQKP
jgi:Ca-activated chloride channel family protein